jgi:hypothetical protein
MPLVMAAAAAGAAGQAVVQAGSAGERCEFLDRRSYT